MLGAQPGARTFLCSVPEWGWQERHCQGQPSCGRALLAGEREGAGDDGVSQAFHFPSLCWHRRQRGWLSWRLGMQG